MMWRIQIAFAVVLMAPALAPAQTTVSTWGLVTRAADGYYVFGSGELVFSPDGRSFQRLAKLPYTPSSVAAGGDGIWAMCRWGTLTSFTRQGLPKFGTEEATGVRFVATDGYHLFAGGDSQVWKLQPDNSWARHLVEEGAEINALAFGLGGCVAVGVGYENPAAATEDGEDEPPRVARIWHSRDGTKWTRLGLPVVPRDYPPNLFTQMAFTGKRFLAIGPSQWAAVSDDGRAWRWLPLPDALSNISGAGILASAGGEFWVRMKPAGGTEAVYRSRDGEKWEPQTVPANITLGNLVAGGTQAVFLAKRAGAAEAELATLEEFARDMTQEAATALNPKETALVAAWERFDNAMGGSQPGRYPAPVANMLAALRANAAATPFVPVLGDAFRDQAGQFVEAVAGLDGYLKLVLAAGDKDYGALVKRLPAPKKELLREAAGAHADNAAYAQRNQPQIAQGPDPKKVAAHWPVNALLAVKPAQRPWFDLAVLRRRLVRGDKTAAFDLAMAHNNGFSTPANPNLASLYFELYVALGGARHDGVDPKNEALMKQLAEAGSAWAMLPLATIRLAQAQDPARRETLVAEAVRWLEQSCARGFLAAALELGAFYHDGKFVPADQAKASLWYARGGGQPPPQPKVLTPEERRAVVALLENFERKMLATRDRVTMATAVAELVAALEPKLPGEKFDPFFDGAFKYVGSFCGFRGLAHYMGALRPELREETLANMKPDFRALFDKALLAVAAKRVDDPALQEGQSRLPAPESLLVEPMRSDLFNPAVARERLAAGDEGGALDLMLCYQNGTGTPFDMELSHFYQIFADAAFPELAQKVRAGQMTRAEANLKGGSARALADHATPLFNATKFKDAEKSKEAIEMLVRAKQGGDQRAAQLIEQFKAEHEQNKKALIAQTRAQAAGSDGYTRRDVERKAEQLAQAVREGRFADVFQAGKPSARPGNRTLWDLLEDSFGTPQRKLGTGYLTARVEALAKEINPVLKERKLVFFGQEVFDATDPAKAAELMNRVIAQAAPPFQGQLRAALGQINRQNRSVKMAEAIAAAQLSEALRLLRVAERGDWRSIPRGKTGAEVLAGTSFDALFGLSTASGITTQSLEAVTAFAPAQIDGSLHLTLGGQGFQINGPVTVDYEHSSRRLQLTGERLLRAAERGKHGKIERPAELDGRLNFTLNFQEDGTLFLVWAFHTGKNGQAVDLLRELKKPNGDTYSQSFLFVPAK